jgi:hypothetical protein
MARGWSQIQSQSQTQSQNWSQNQKWKPASDSVDLEQEPDCRIDFAFELRSPMPRQVSLCSAMCSGAAFGCVCHRYPSEMKHGCSEAEQGTNAVRAVRTDPFCDSFKTHKPRTSSRALSEFGCHVPSACGILQASSFRREIVSTFAR